jgi:hypothetical protein
MRNRERMRIIVIALIIVCSTYSMPCNAEDEMWQTVSVPGICTFQIPPTMEIQKGTYKEMNDKFRGKILGITSSPDRVAA